MSASKDILEIGIIYRDEEFMVGKLEDFYLFWKIKGDIDNQLYNSEEGTSFGLETSWDFDEFRAQHEDVTIKMDIEVTSDDDELLLGPIDDKEQVNELKRRIVAERL